MNPAITNIAAYQFAHLTDLKQLRERLAAQCKVRGLKGTILLSTEGINLFVAGWRPQIDALVEELRSIQGLEHLAPKYSDSVHQPFRRMLVRIKKEIIAFGVEGIDPAARTSPKLPASILKQWLDEGRPLTLLDTRNDYEVKLGTFEKALPLGIKNFRQFPDAVRQLPETMKDETIVMFCTGGIRCEKAGPFMEREGFRKVFQLDGGILKYFEECGPAHYEGECFVFDQRVGVDPALRETHSTQCYACQAPLTEEEQADPRYQAGKSCPYCFKTPAQEMAAVLERRHEDIRSQTHPLPGSEPYEGLRPLSVPQIHDRSRLLEFLCAIFPHAGREEWRRLCEEGRFVNEGKEVLGAESELRAGQRLFHKLPFAAEPDVRANIRIQYEDAALCVVEKPAPLPMHPSGRFNRNTLQWVLNAVYAPEKPRPVHRLDANTTGLVICARTRHFARLLQAQFAAGAVEKVYVALVQGMPSEDEFSCDAPISAGPRDLGARVIDEEEGLPALTRFIVLERRSDGHALLQVLPETGRTNQIRVHLWQLGYPIAGDPAYLPGGKLGEAMTLALDAAPLCLHAWKMDFLHPLTGERVFFEAPLPEWAGNIQELDSSVAAP